MSLNPNQISKDELIGTGLKNRTKKALDDDFLRKSIAFTTDRLRGGKYKAMEEFGDWEEWRNRARDIRTHTIRHLDYYLNVFADNVAKNGGHVYFVKDDHEAVKTFIEIADKKGAKLVA